VRAGRHFGRGTHRRLRARLPRGLLSAGVALVLAVTAACGPPELPRLGPDAHILAFGDSLTHGSGVAAEDSYPAVLARRLERPVIRAGVPGEHAQEGLERLPRVLDETQPEMVILCHGGNDILADREPQAIRDALLAMVRTIQRRDIPVVLVGVPAKGLMGSTADVYYEVADRTGVPLEDQAMARIIADASLKSDPIHPNAAGYRELAAAIHRLLAETGAVEAPE